MTQPHDSSSPSDRLRVLFEHSSTAHFICDETGITDYNDACIRLLKASDKSHVLAQHPASLAPEYQPDGSRLMEKRKEMEAVARDSHRFEWIHHVERRYPARHDVLVDDKLRILSVGSGPGRLA